MNRIKINASTRTWKSLRSRAFLFVFSTLVFALKKRRRETNEQSRVSARAVRATSSSAVRVRTRTRLKGRETPVDKQRTNKTRFLNKKHSAEQIEPRPPADIRAARKVVRRASLLTIRAGKRQERISLTNARMHGAADIPSICYVWYARRVRGSRRTVNIAEFVNVARRSIIPRRRRDA